MATFDDTTRPPALQEFELDEAAVRLIVGIFHFIKRPETLDPANPEQTERALATFDKVFPHASVDDLEAALRLLRRIRADAALMRAKLDEATSPALAPQSK